MRFGSKPHELQIDATDHGIEFAANEWAVIQYDQIWDVIDYLIEIAGPRAIAPQWYRDEIEGK